MNAPTTSGTIEREGALVAEASTVELLNRSEIDVQIATAKKYPRSIQSFRNEALAMVTLNEAIAQECIYALPRDGKVIEGPSARLAEVLASAWGNCRAGARTVDEAGEFVTAQGVFHDLQRNVAITYEVKRRITDRSGRRYKADMIGVTANAACSIALRNAVMKGIPKAFWSDIYEAARKTVMGDFKTLENRRADALKAFQAFGVSAERIFETLDVKGIEDVTLEHLVTLRGLLTALREGETTVEQAFPVKSTNGDGQPKTATESVKDALRARQATQPASEPAAPAADAPAAADETFGMKLREWVDYIGSAKDAQELAALSETVPQQYREHDDFAKAVKAKLDSLKAPR
jgi:hypothetical protein